MGLTDVRAANDVFIAEASSCSATDRMERRATVWITAAPEVSFGNLRRAKRNSLSLSLSLFLSFFLSLSPSLSYFIFQNRVEEGRLRTLIDENQQS